VLKPAYKLPRRTILRVSTRPASGFKISAIYVDTLRKRASQFLRWKNPEIPAEEKEEAAVGSPLR